MMFHPLFHLFQQLVDHSPAETKGIGLQVREHHQATDWLMESSSKAPRLGGRRSQTKNQLSREKLYFFESDFFLLFFVCWFFSF